MQSIGPICYEIQREENMLRKYSKQWATGILILMTCIFLGTYPFREYMWCALVMHMSGAAMIGGLADWYAVTALFSKPLGISYKTAIVPRSKKRLIEMARHMIIDELLRVRHMYKVLKKEDAPRRVMQYIVSKEGQKEVDVLMDEICHHILPHFNTDLLRGPIFETLKKSISAWSATPIVLHILEGLLQPSVASVLWIHVNKTMQRVLSAEGSRYYIMAIVDSVMERYTEDSWLRELAFLLGGEKFTPEYISALVQEKGRIYLQSQLDFDSKLGRFFYAQLEHIAYELRHNEKWQQLVEEKKNKWISTALDDIDFIGNDADWKTIIEQGRKEINHVLEEILDEPRKEEGAQRFILLHLRSFLQKLRPYAERAVVTQLEMYTEREITQLLQSKMDYDLQMVRINGSLVGAMLGGLFFVLHTLVLKGGM